MNFNFLAIFLMALYEKAAEVFAPKKAGTLSVHLPEKNAKMLGAAIKALGGFR